MAAQSVASSALRFLFVEGDAPFRPTICWIKPEPGKLNDWSLQLEQPDEFAVAVRDLKRWMLFGDTDNRTLLFSSGTVKRDMRQFSRDDVLERYARAVVAALPPEHRQGPHWCLVPSIGDADRRRRYRNALERAIPGVMLLPEPEMLLEYFRLVRRELTLREGYSSIFLVVDAGASTVNLTFVLTRRDRLVTTAKEGVARKASLRAKRGNASQFAGAWVDEQLARMIGVVLPASGPERAQLLAEVERIKCKLSRANAGSTRGRVLATGLPSRRPMEREDLEEVADQLWAALVPTYLGQAGQLLADLQSGADAEFFSERLASVGGPDVAGVQHLIDGVIVAGGTSQLPGFRRAMLQRLFPDRQDLELFYVGEDYSVAASLGALANVLAVHRRPPRLRLPKPATHAKPGNLADATFIGTPVTDIYLAWKRGQAHEDEVLVLDRDDPIFDRGGEQPFHEPLPDVGKGSVEARLVPGPGFSRIGIKPTRISVNKSPPAMSIDWDAKSREGRVRSPDAGRTGQLHIALHHLQLEDDDQAPRPQRLPAQNSTDLWCDGAPDVVLDLGMSKTVVATTTAGPFVWPAASATPPSRGGEAEDAKSPTAPGPRSSAPLVETPPPADDGTHTRSTAPPGSLPPPPHEDLPAPAAPDAPPEPPRAPPTATQAPRLAHGLPAEAPDGLPRPQPLRLPPAQFGEQLRAALAPLTTANMARAAADLTALLLALSIRPFVLLAGPPGCGKSTLVRAAAKLLGLEERGAFHDVSVQPHWRRHENLPREVRDALVRATGLTMCLLDEVNLAPAESYLMPLFRRHDIDQRGETALLCGTLNIDDASRPPSPKVVDRAFFLALDAPSDARIRPSPLGLVEAGALGALPTLIETPPASPGRPFEVVQQMQAHVQGNHLRQDLSPSLRDVMDLERLVATYDACGISDLLSRDDLDDLAIAGRLLTKVAGPVEQVGSLIEDLRRYFDAHEPLRRCRRAMALAQAQLRLGFVSPWQ